MTIKRLFDIVSSVLGLIVLSPLFVVLYGLIMIFLGKPVFFVQTRPGLREKPFRLIKFRTMKNLFTPEGALLPDHERITKFGAFLRSTSLDELPELINVLLGDMSIVGPRPLLMEYLPLYNKVQKERHHVRPGLTGWAQINGRNCTSWQERFEHDVWYVRNRSFLLDMKIILLTIGMVFSRKGITHGDHVSMPNFKGNEETTGLQSTQTQPGKGRSYERSGHLP